MTHALCCGTYAKREGPSRNSLKACANIHGYALVNVDTVWNIVQNALPGLLSTVKTLLADMG